MEAYTNIQTTYTYTSELNEDNMATVYSNEEYLKEIISTVMSNHLTKEKITGKKILLKPNWVSHNKVEKDEVCLRTNDAFLLAALEVLLQMQPKEIVLGDAPIQGCQWNKMLNTEFLSKVDYLSKKYGIYVNIKDFRRVIFNTEINQLEQDKNTIEDFIIFDIGEKSYLENVSDDSRSLFRVTSYDPSRLAISHKKGTHKYCITKELFDADVVITVPKIKTHQKVGLTNALKILVGVNGDKDFLPHHRRGSIEEGGDCYPNKNLFRKLSENILDYANTKIGKDSYKALLKISNIFWRISRPNAEQNLAAGWYGNDTTWRMVLDINQIVLYGKSDGTIADNLQRELYSLCDGIIAGQGNGPLNPEPLPLGIVAFSNNSALMDIVAGYLMGMNIEKIPLLKNAVKWLENKEISVSLNKKKYN
ncbi:MAG: DUF362 domain-containing protein [Paludibacter sp.]|nr:DUF362 domain-containing protein [Paludibacter sp.]